MPELRLDDRSYEDLVTEARALIPAYAPDWTDHNPSDPGIALIELFAWLAEMLIFRTDQIPDPQRTAFLRLLNGPEWVPPDPIDVALEVGAGLRAVRERWRAVTPEDYVAIVPGAAPGRIARVHCAPRRDLAAAPEADAPGTVSIVILPELGGEVRIVGEDGSERRVLAGGPAVTLPEDASRSVWIGASSAFAGVRIALATPGAGYTPRFQYHDGTQWRGFQVDDDGTAALTRSGTVSFRPPQGWAPRPGDEPPRYWIRFTTTTTASRAARARRLTPAMPRPDAALLNTVRAHLEPRRILTTRPVVVGAAFVPVGVELLVAREPGASPDAVRADIAARLEAFLDPLTGGSDGAGWPLGRPLYLRELEQIVDGVPGVDHVPDVFADSPGATSATPLLHPDGDPVGLDIGASRLPDARIDEQRIVSAVRFVSVRVRLAVTIVQGAQPTAARAAVKAAVRSFMHPLHGGPSGTGGEWPAADLEAAVRAVPGVAQVTAELAAEPPDKVIYRIGQVLKLDDDELVDVTTEIALS